MYSPHMPSADAKCKKTLKTRFYSSSGASGCTLTGFVNKWINCEVLHWIMCVFVLTHFLTFKQIGKGNTVTSSRHIMDSLLISVPRISSNMSSRDSKKKQCRFYEYQVEEEHQQKELRNVRYSNVWSGFRATTSSHGVPHIDNARGMFFYWQYVQFDIVKFLMII